MLKICKGYSKNNGRLKHSERLCIMTAMRIEALVLSKVTTLKNIEGEKDTKIIKDNSLMDWFKIMYNKIHKELPEQHLKPILFMNTLEITLINKMI